MYRNKHTNCINSHPFMQTDAPWTCPGLVEPKLGHGAETPPSTFAIVYASCLFVKALQSPAFARLERILKNLYWPKSYQTQLFRCAGNWVATLKATEYIPRSREHDLNYLMTCFHWTQENRVLQPMAFGVRLIGFGNQPLPH